MADPITILGTAGAIANIIDVLGKTISSIAELRAQWQSADLTVMTLECQLAALTSALDKIKEWAESGTGETHYQLSMRLDRSVECCRVLVGKIDSEIAQFNTTTDNRLDGASKFRLLLNTKEFEHIQRMIEQQTGALNLLLTAQTMSMVSEQKAFLERPQSRKTFRRVEKDTTSLLVHRDVDSLATRHTMTSISSRFKSTVFDFDTELLASGIYQLWIRGSVKKTLHRQQGDIWRRNPASKRHTLQSLHELGDINPQRLKYTKKLVLMGPGSKEDIVNTICMECVKTSSLSELLRSKTAIFRCLVDSAKAIVLALRKQNIAAESDEIWEHANYISDYPESVGSGSVQVFPELDCAFGESLGYILRSQSYQALMEQRAELSLQDSVVYFIAESARILSTGYRPTMLDVTQAKTQAATTSGTVLKLPRSRHSTFLLSIDGEKSEESVKHEALRNATVFFVVDLDKYDDGLSHGGINGAYQALKRFAKSIRTEGVLLSMRLVWVNVDILRRKMAQTPIESLFPECDAGKDVDKAVDYFDDRFGKALRLTHPPPFELPRLASIRLGSTNSPILEHVSRALARTDADILGNALWETGFLV